jgi:hypothetical protein
MTELRAAQIEIVCEPRLTLSALPDLRHLVTLYLSSLVPPIRREVTMRQQEAGQGRLFEDNNFVRVPPLQKEVAQPATRELMQWMRVLAKAMGAGMSDEENKR